MVFSLVCIRGKLLVLRSLCNSWMTLSLCILRKALTPESERFCNHQWPLTFSILSLHGLVKQTSSFTPKIPKPSLHFSWQEGNWKRVSRGTRKRNWPLKTNNIWNGLICTGLALSGDICHHWNMAYHFLWRFLQIQTGLKSLSTIIIN